MSIARLISGNGTINVLLENKVYTVSPDHINYKEILEKLPTAKEKDILTLVNVKKFIDNYTYGKVSLRNGIIYYNNSVLHNNLVDRILAIRNEGLPFDYMLRFLENLMANPSFRSRNELYDFLSNVGLPITDDGCFIAYKAVRQNYYDIHSGKYRNTVGTVNEIDRGEVDDDREKTCSFGFHVGHLDYARQFGGSGSRFMLVKVNPKDAVSVPTDYSCQKLRVCKYSVIAEYGNDSGVIQAPVVKNSDVYKYHRDDRGRFAPKN